MSRDQRREHDVSAAERWSEMRSLPWWSAFEESCRSSVSCARVAALCLLERTAWALMPEHELPWLSSFDFQNETTNVSDEGCIAALSSPDLTSRTSRWLRHRLTELQMTTGQAAAIVDEARQRIL